MEIIFNGSPLETQAENLARLIQQQGIDTAGIAVAVGTRVIPRGAWEQTPLEAQCAVTVIRATQGG